jgi:hypothetical protein
LTRGNVRGFPGLIEVCLIQAKYSSTLME